MLMVRESGAVAGVHRNWPLTESIAAPEGAPGPRLKVSCCGGASVSLALAVKTRVCPRVHSLSLMAARIGALLGKTFGARGGEWSSRGYGPSHRGNAPGSRQWFERRTLRRRSRSEEHTSELQSL